MTLASQETLEENQLRITIPKCYLFVVFGIWELQLKLEQKSKKKVNAIVCHQRFRANYDFLLLRESVEDCNVGLGKWWTKEQKIISELNQYAKAKIARKK